MLRQDIARLPIFQGFTEEQLAFLCDFFYETQFSQAEVVFEQGQPADRLYILVKGEVVVSYKPYDGPPLTVAHIFPGGVYGWSAALGRRVYTSGARAVVESAALCIHGQELHRLCDQYPETGGIFLDRLAGVIAERLRESHPQILNMLNEGMGITGKA